MSSSQQIAAEEPTSRLEMIQTNAPLLFTAIKSLFQIKSSTQIR